MDTISTDFLIAVRGGQAQNAAPSRPAPQAGTTCSPDKPKQEYVPPLWQVPGPDYVPYQG